MPALANNSVGSSWGIVALDGQKVCFFARFAIIGSAEDPLAHRDTKGTCACDGSTSCDDKEDDHATQREELLHLPTAQCRRTRVRCGHRARACVCGVQIGRACVGSLHCERSGREPLCTCASGEACCRTFSSLTKKSINDWRTFSPVHSDPFAAAMLALASEAETALGNRYARSEGVVIRGRER